MTVEINEDLVLGIDLGIGSCGWALIEDGASGQGKIKKMGVRMFDVPETAKDRTPTNQIRRQNRLMRRVIKRRRQRMNEIRRLFAAHGLLGDERKQALATGLDPWRLRAEGLDRPLTAIEMAVALGHIAKHRGFKSNSKRDKGANATKETSEMLSAISATQGRLKDFRTVGEMFARDSEFEKRKRNRDGNFDRSVLRDDQEREVKLLLDRQRHMGNALASPDLEREFIETAFFQRPLQDSDERVGWCPFEPDQRRAAKHSLGFELFRLAARLTSLRVRNHGGEYALTGDQIVLAMADFGAPGVKLTYKRLRKLLGVPDGDLFDVPLEEEGKREIASRSGDQAAGTKAFRRVLGDAWKSLVDSPGKLDRAAAFIAFRETPESIRKGLEEVGFEPLVLEALMTGVEDGEFAHFKGAAHISAKAARNLLPHLMQGLVYSDACKAAGYDHAHKPATDLDAIANPIARKALGEALKQVKAIVGKYGLPGAIHVELARDVGKSKEERDEMARGIEKRNKSKDRLREQFTSDTGREKATAEDLLRYELWKEQGSKCIYTGDHIPIEWVAGNNNLAEVDHILPWSRSGDDSFINKTLCTAKANRDKKGRTPFEWFGKDEAAWAAFTARVESNKAFKGRKKRNYLLRDARVLEEKFRPRNLTDTQYATRVFAELVARQYPGDGTRRVFTRPGALTNRLRQAWGIQGLKKGPDGKRLPDDRHHALDALIVAATTEGALQRLTRAAQVEEERGSSRFISEFPMPWPSFRAEFDAFYSTLFVSRAERGRVRGEAHAATIRSVVETEDGKVVYERKSVEALKETDLDRIKDKERNTRVVEALRAWIAADKPKDAPPLSPKGDPIRKISLVSNKKVDVLVRDGAADRGEMVRVDVFRKKNKKGVFEFFLVPIYPHQVADKEQWPTPPNGYIQGGGVEVELSLEHEYIFSFSSMSFLELVKPDGEVIEGYFRSFDRNTGALTISEQSKPQNIRKGIGTRSVRSFRKFAIDRLGNRREIEQETRTWRGVACT